MKKLKEYWDYYLFVVGELVTLIILYIMLEMEMFENPEASIVILFCVTVVLATVRAVRIIRESKKK